jgi:hypothetical protein
VDAVGHGARRRHGHHDRVGAGRPDRGTASHGAWIDGGGRAADLNEDGNVDALDFLLLVSQWGSPGVCP